MRGQMGGEPALHVPSLQSVSSAQGDRGDVAQAPAGANSRALALLRFLPRPWFQQHVVAQVASPFLSSATSFAEILLVLALVAFAFIVRNLNQSADRISDFACKQKRNASSLLCINDCWVCPELWCAELLL
eukprot:TRINITY_DN2279_c0_g1_i1.p3 TRINITY_DN2279_c0_g1~~TRINITY_DN2279_c0_g1_i1.p3  ORF type:complete len:131 (-),score=14.00 TRINITY_DN2279_c0_g1_i1:184-576(-)